MLKKAENGIFTPKKKCEYSANLTALNHYNFQNQTQMKHTPTPWRFDDLEMKIKGTDDVNSMTVIANVSPKMDYSRGMTTQCANAERIVVCVNACEGLSTEELAVVPGYKAAIDGFHEQRDEATRLYEQVKVLERRLQHLGSLAHEIIGDGIFVEDEKRQYRMRINGILGIAAGGGQ